MDKLLGAQFRTLADAIGCAATILICQHHGGEERIYITKNPESEHPFRNIIGDAKFARLTDLLGGHHLDVPMSPKGLPKKVGIIDDLLGKKMSNRVIARRNRVSMRYVRQIRAELVNLGILERWERPSPDKTGDTYGQE